MPNVSSFEPTTEDLEILRSDFMEKKSQTRSRFSPDNYKHRWFLLTRHELRYHDGSAAMGWQKLKGGFRLEQVQVVEEVSREASHNHAKDYMFQVSYVDAADNNVYTLYIRAQTETMRQEWIQLLRKECDRAQARLSLKYHPGMWIRRLGHFTCCKKIGRFTPGCKPSFLIRSTCPLPLVNTYPEDDENQTTVISDSPPSSIDSKTSSNLELSPRKTSVSTIYEFDDDINEISSLDNDRLQGGNDPISSMPKSCASKGWGSDRSDMTDYIEADYSPPKDGTLTPQDRTRRKSSTSTSCGSDTGSDNTLQGRFYYSTAQDDALSSDWVRVPPRRKVSESLSCGSDRVDDLFPFRVQARYDYSPLHAGDLELERGEEYDIMCNSEKFWWEARDRHGAVGFIPKEYVDRISSHGLEKYAWYYRNMSCREAQALLMKEKKEGCFVIRNASKSGIRFSLSVYCLDGERPSVKHYHIRQNEEGKFYFSDRHAFESIPDLVEYHSYNSGGIAVRLKTTPNQPYGVLHQLSEKWQIDADQLTLQEELGKGEFGTVYKALWARGSDADSERIKVAVKMLKPGTMTEDKFIEEAETMTLLQFLVGIGILRGLLPKASWNPFAKTTRKIHAPNLVQIYGLCVTKRPIYIVTEYMKYGSLQLYLVKNKEHLLPRRVFMLDICLQVGKGMAYLETHGFIHRDLAARNCLVGERFTVKVADFGLTRFVLDDEYTSSTGAKFPIRWAAPEVLNFCRFSSKSDVWAFGILMWEVFSYGELPYSHLSNAQVCDVLMENTDRLPKPRHCSPQLYQLISTCWAQEPDERPTFSSLLLEIEALKLYELTGHRLTLTEDLRVSPSPSQRRTLTRDTEPTYAD